MPKGPEVGENEESWRRIDASLVKTGMYIRDRSTGSEGTVLFIESNHDEYIFQLKPPKGAGADEIRVGKRKTRAGQEIVVRESN